MATAALNAFADLGRFFERDTQRAVALGWDEATVAEWRDKRVVRPQRAKVSEVVLLRELCQEARAYLDSDSDVGLWVNAPLPNLKGASPAGWLRDKGRVGLKQLTHGMVDWMPKLPENDLEPIAYTPPTGDDAGARELQRMIAELS